MNYAARSPSLRHRAVLTVSLAWIAAGILLGASAPAWAVGPPGVGDAAPPFSLTSADGRPRTLQSYRGRPTALFFFCGCAWCRECATAWVHRKKPTEKALQAVRTVVVFSGDLPSAQAFGRDEGLLTADCDVLADPYLAVTRRYGSETCPRVFVLDAGGVVRYTNNSPDDAPRSAPAAMIVQRASSTLNLLASSSAPAPAQPAAAQPPPQISVTAVDGVRVSPSGEARYEFGIVDGLDRTRVDHTFVLKNTGSQWFAIDRVQGSCECTTAAVVGPNAGAPAVPVAPGAEARVRVNVDLSDLPSGRVWKAGLVYVSGQSAPAATLVMAGAYSSPISYSQPVVGFGPVQPGAHPSQLIVAYVDTRIAGAVRDVCTNPDVDVVATSTPAWAAAQAPPDTSTRPMAYTLTLKSSMPQGPIVGSLYFTRASGADPEPVGRAVSLVGMVTGAVRAVPAILQVGAVDNASPRRLNLFGPQAELHGIKAEPSVPWLIVSIDTPTPSQVQSTGAGPLYSLALTITLKPDAPRVTYRQARIIIELGSGQKMVVPVYKAEER